MLPDSSKPVSDKTRTVHSPRYTEFLADKILWRHCGACYCRSNYLKQLNCDKLATLFLPINHRYFQ
jgi:hypothetical protein